MMRKTELGKQGKQFHANLKACLRWLAIGGTINLKGGYELAMDEHTGQPGFLVTQSSGNDSMEMIMMLGSSDTWMFLISHANKMTEDEYMTMIANLALNSN